MLHSEIKTGKNKRNVEFKQGASNDTSGFISDAQQAKSGFNPSFMHMPIESKHSTDPRATPTGARRKSEWIPGKIARERETSVPESIHSDQMNDVNVVPDVVDRPQQPHSMQTPWGREVLFNKPNHFKTSKKIV